jgi:hypothetical protein
MDPNHPLYDLEDQFDVTDLLIMTGFDDCIVGVVERFGCPPIVCYDKAKVIAQLAQTMGEEDAEEFFEFNQIGAWLGEATPCFITTLESQED